jgi:uronate dehydrogenase
MASPGLTLVTGSAGCVGGAAARGFATRGLPVRCFDRFPTPGFEDQVVGDLLDRSACERAMAGVTTLIHLAATPDDVDDPVGGLFGPNIVGVHNMFEAARAAKVRRIVLASTCQYVWGYLVDGPHPIKTDVQPAPRHWYAATKVFLEAAGRFMAVEMGISVFAIRIGTFPRPGQENFMLTTDWAQDIYLSPNDAGRFFVATAQAQCDAGFKAFYATSKPFKKCRLDLEPARTILGYEPQETWPQGFRGKV